MWSVASAYAAVKNPVAFELRDFQYNNISGRLPVRCTFPATPAKSIGMATASPGSARTTAERLPSLQMMSFPSSRGAWMRMLTAVPKKQHHTAKRIYDRLVEEYGFTGGETTVRRLVHQLREKARKALMTLRLTQCHQNWLTMMEHPANFEDRSLWKYNALSLKNHNLIAVPSGSTENRYGAEPFTDSSCPYFSRVKSRISYVDRGHPKDCVNLRCGVELTNIFAATPNIN